MGTALHLGADPAAWLLPVAAALVPGVLYLAGAARYRRRRLRRWSLWRSAAFGSGVLVAALAVSPLVDGVAHGDPRGHMVQHLALGMFAPLGLVLGAPVTLLLGTVSVRVRRAVAALLGSRVFHGVSHPVTAAVLNVGSLYLLYLTPLYALSGESDVVHHLLHAHFLLAGYLFSWAVAGPDPAPRRPGMGLRVAVLVLSAGAHAYLGKLLYARAGELPPGSGHGVPEMQQAAQLMYYGGDLAELLLAAALFAAWYRRRERVPARFPARQEGSA